MCMNGVVCLLSSLLSYIIYIVIFYPFLGVVVEGEGIHYCLGIQDWDICKDVTYGFSIYVTSDTCVP